MSFKSFTQVLALCLPLVAQAQLVAIQCQYDTFIHQEEKRTLPDFNLVFTIDNETGKAYMAGSADTAEVSFARHEQGEQAVYTFIQQHPTGGGSMTTILEDGESVHVRNLVNNNSILPALIYGRCTFK